jgi:hypothetical protein
MTVASLARELRLAAGILFCALALIAGVAVPAWGASETGLRFDPVATQVMSGETLTLALWLDDVQDLHRVELHLDYDQGGLAVQDADPGRVGVQIEPGPVFCASCVLWNEALSGRINFVAQRDPLDGSFFGSGVVAYITFLVTAIEPDTYAVSFDQATTRLFDSAGQPITVGEFTAAMLTLPPPLVTLTGWLTRDGSGSEARSVANAVLYPVVSPFEPISWGRACTDTKGDFTLRIVDHPQSPPADILPADDPPASPVCASRWAFVRLAFTSYLSECYWECAGSDPWHIGWHDLEGGDVNADGCINILDIVSIIGDFGQVVETPCDVPCAACPPDSASSGVAPSCDVNGDCRVNILDLTQTAGNFGLCSNCP